MIKLFKDHFESKDLLETAISDANSIIEEWRTSEGVPAPVVHPIIKQIIDGAEYEYIDRTIEEQREFEIKEATEKLEAEKLEAQTTPSKRYAEFRLSEYPSMPDQLDFIYHNGIDAWKKDMIDPVKKRYPKP